MGISASVVSSTEKWKGDSDWEGDGADGVSRLRVVVAVDGVDDVVRLGVVDGVDDVVRSGVVVVAAMEIGMEASVDAVVVEGFVGSVMVVDGAARWQWMCREGVSSIVLWLEWVYMLSMLLPMRALLASGWPQRLSMPKS
ncbi:hypothetical protein CBR_g45937 [Chara braunii]|uniref:Uncharacterized protein n=1 Tax=Chara braunii TaxID=69332 RepID=A0A388LZW0_CHABU|nr:hypothetical protein CBR_g45937 [Chara braunii]|eukprot:GBG87782.1 hypothetical protein CBR_g45937 [Chara braunii]